MLHKKVLADTPNAFEIVYLRNTFESTNLIDRSFNHTQKNCYEKSI